MDLINRGEVDNLKDLRFKIWEDKRSFTIKTGEDKMSLNIIFLNKDREIWLIDNYGYIHKSDHKIWGIGNEYFIYPLIPQLSTLSKEDSERFLDETYNWIAKKYIAT